MARRARFTVSSDLLAQAINLPKTTKVIDVFRDHNTYYGDYEFIVEHEDLDDIAEGSKIPRVCPIITATEHETIKPGVFVNTYEWDWGLDD
jgi:hypothetical protein